MFYAFNKGLRVLLPISEARKTGAIYCVAFSMSVAVNCLQLGMVFRLRDQLGADKSQVGWFTGLWAITYIVACLGLAPFFRRALPRRLVLASCCVTALSALAMAFSNDCLWAMMAQGLLGVSIASLWPPLAGWLSLGHEGAGLSKIMSRFNLSWSSGTIAAPYLAGWLCQFNNLWAVYAALGLSLFSVAALVVAGYIPSVRAEEALFRGASASARAATKKDAADERTFLRFPGLIGLFLACVILAALTSLFPMYGRENLGLDKLTIGRELFFRSLVTTVGFVMLGRMSFWRFKGWPMLTAQVALGVSVLLLACARSSWAIAGVFFLYSVIYSYCYATSQFHMLAGSADRSRVVAVNESVLAFGFAVGPILGGYLYQIWSFETMFQCFAIAIFAAWPVEALLCAIHRRRHERLRKRFADTDVPSGQNI